MPADVKLVEGSILLDRSMLTGESVPIEAGPGVQTYAGALVRRGEATAIVTATGADTKLVWTHRRARRGACGAKSCHVQRDWVCFQRDCPLWTKPQRWTFITQRSRLRNESCIHR
jgi:magnesium-transporting ATPase (P-type)